MTERGILFSGAMVRALLDGTKTQTRRICKSQPYSNGFHFDGHDILCHNDYLPPSAMLMDYREGGQTYTTSNMEGWEFCCPYGRPGDHLWVRETLACTAHHGTWYDADPDGFSNIIDDERADALASRYGDPYFATEVRRIPSIHMPRWASRILLEIVSVRVERLQDISEADADAEGCERLESERYDRDWNLCPKCGGTRLHRDLGPGGGVIEDVDCVECDMYVKRYRHLWESINGAGSWAANPWVWVVEFRRIG